jgi:5-dehydro-2-deoxygluconokinase
VPLEVLTMGRVGVDLYPEQIGMPLAKVQTFRKLLGGSATNVAVGAARHGRESAVITKVGDDGFGRYVRKAIAGFGVDNRFVGTHPELRTPLVFCEIFPPDDFPPLFYREPTAPDLTITEHEVPLDEVRAAPLFWMTGTGLCEEPSRSATMLALRARAGGAVTVFDLDWRLMFWQSPEEARPLYREALSLATVLVGNRAETAVAVGELGPEDTARSPLERVIRFAKAAGALVAARLGCADDMPTSAEVETLIGAGA